MDHQQKDPSSLLRTSLMHISRMRHLIKHLMCLSSINKIYS